MGIQGHKNRTEIKILASHATTQSLSPAPSIVSLWSPTESDTWAQSQKWVCALSIVALQKTRTNDFSVINILHQQKFQSHLL